MATVEIILKGKGAGAYTIGRDATVYKALAEVTALLALKKKIAEIWGDGDDDTPTRSGT